MLQIRFGTGNQSNRLPDYTELMVAHFILEFVLPSMFLTVLGIRDILVRIRMRIRILGSLPLTNGSRCGCGPLVKSHKEVTKLKKSKFSYYFRLMMEGSGAGSGAGSVLLTNGSGCGSGRPKNIRIRIRLRIRIPITGYCGKRHILCPTGYRIFKSKKKKVVR